MCLQIIHRITTLLHTYIGYIDRYFCNRLWRPAKQGSTPPCLPPPCAVPGQERQASTRFPSPFPPPSFCFYLKFEPVNQPAFSIFLIIHQKQKVKRPYKAVICVGLHTPVSSHLHGFQNTTPVYSARHIADRLEIEKKTGLSTDYACQCGDV